jgi:hypothetical protein
MRKQAAQHASKPSKLRGQLTRIRFLRHP